MDRQRPSAKSADGVLLPRRRKRPRSVLKAVMAATAASGYFIVLIFNAHKGFQKIHDYVHPNLSLGIDNNSSSTSNNQHDNGIFIAVTTTRNNWRRVSSILNSWWNFDPRGIAFFTDPGNESLAMDSPGWSTREMSDALLSNPTRDTFNLIDTRCSLGHTMEGLCCKTAANIQYYHQHSTADWLCHADDDTFVNYPTLETYLAELNSSQDHFIGHAAATLPIRKEKHGPAFRAARKELERDGNGEIHEFFTIAGGAGWCLSRPVVTRGIDKLASLPQSCVEINFSDDTTLGYVVQVELGVPMKNEMLLNSHLDNQNFASKEEAIRQLTFGSGYKDETVLPAAAIKPGAKIDMKSLIAANKKRVFNFVAYPGASFVTDETNRTKQPPGHDLLGFHALYCDFWPEKCSHYSRME